MSADTTPISPARFASALKDLSIGMLHLKVLEIRNSIAHLEYSNDQLRPYANGTAVASPTSTTSPSNGTAAAPDQDCIDAINENEQVIDRMHDRIALVRAEVQDRGMSWTEFESKEDLESKHPDVAAASAVESSASTTTPAAATSDPWTDGTFQTGTIRDGQVQLDDIPGAGAAAQQQQPLSNGTAAGGSLNDDQLRAALEERMRQLQGDGDDEGMHL